MSEQSPAGLEDVIALLMGDHDEVRNLFREYKKLMDLEAPAQEREALATRICNALTVHATVEEEAFYPRARESLPEDKEELVDHADVEHGSIKQLIARIEAMEPDDEHFDATVHVLGEYVAHHVREEEEEMFSELRHGDEDFSAVAKRIRDRKAALEAQVADAGVPGKRVRAGAAVKSEAVPAAKRARVAKGTARKAVRKQGSSRGRAKS